MRQTSDELSKKYLKNPEVQERELTRIRIQYSKLKRPEKGSTPIKRQKVVHSIERV